MKILPAGLVLLALLYSGMTQLSPPPTQRDPARGLVDITSGTNVASVSSAVRIASGLRVGMTKADADKYMQDHGLRQTNVYSISLDRGRTLTCPYPLPGSSNSLMLEMQCSRVRPGLFDWGHPVLSKAYIQSQGTNIISIIFTNRPEDGAGSWSRPIRLETNSTAVTDGSRR